MIYASSDSPPVFISPAVSPKLSQGYELGTQRAIISAGGGGDTSQSRLYRLWEPLHGIIICSTDSSGRLLFVCCVFREWQKPLSNYCPFFSMIIGIFQHRSRRRTSQNQLVGVRRRKVRNSIDRKRIETGIENRYRGVNEWHLSRRPTESRTTDQEG